VNWEEMTWVSDDGKTYPPKKKPASENLIKPLGLSLGFSLGHDDKVESPGAQDIPVIDHHVTASSPASGALSSKIRKTMAEVQEGYDMAVHARQVTELAKRLYGNVPPGMLEQMKQYTWALQANTPGISAAAAIKHIIDRYCDHPATPSSPPYVIYDEISQIPDLGADSRDFMYLKPRPDYATLLVAGHACTTGTPVSWSSSFPAADVLGNIIEAKQKAEAVKIKPLTVSPPSPSPSGPWMDIVIHPQSGGICQFSVHADSFWPGGFAHSGYPKEWPAPDLKGARLVECKCGSTGIRPQTVQDAARYIPGGTLSEDGPYLTFAPVSPFSSYALPDGSGKDEADDVHIDWHCTPAEYAELRKVLSGALRFTDSAYVQKLWLDGKLPDLDKPGDKT
jgi:hypothetical protein